MRLFVAVTLGVEARLELSLAAGRLKALFPDLKPVRPDNLHLTLKFLGDVSEDQVLQAEEFCREAACAVHAETLSLGGIGLFPEGGRPRIVWVGLEGNSRPIVDCVSELERRFSQFGIPTESRDFVPHVTVARVSGSIDRKALLGTLQNERLKPLPVSFDSIKLIRSTLADTGARYDVIASLPVEQS